MAKVFPLYYKITLILICFVVGCATSRVRIKEGDIPRLRAVTAADEQYGHEVFSTLVDQFPLSQNDNDVDRARRIVDRLAFAINADQEPWHVYVLEADDVVNAAATRGNHVFVWTGLMRLTDNDSELATVLSHEIGHLLAGHTDPDAGEQANEILSSVLGQAVGIAVQQKTHSGQSADITQKLITETLKGLFVHPETKRQEIEADTIGLYLMAQAGYDPRDATKFWHKVKDMPGFSQGLLQFFSSHPEAKDRFKVLERNTPMALDRYYEMKNRKTYRD